MTDIRLSIMTYNVHSCFGKDRRSLPQRVAEVILMYKPDIVALQEIDVDMDRSGRVHQAHIIADCLNMAYHFHPILFIKEGQYGNAILSRFPMSLIKSDALPAYDHRWSETRGGLWVEVSIKKRKIQVFNTHLGLHRKERRLQARELLGPKWMTHPRCRRPLVFCGDLNAMPGSSVYRLFKKVLNDVQIGLDGYAPGKTWPSYFPVLRIDHMFVSPDLEVKCLKIPRNSHTRQASDHFPIIAELCLTSSGGE